MKWYEVLFFFSIGVFVALFGWFLIEVTLPVRSPCVEFQRAHSGTVCIAPRAVHAVLGPGLVELDDGGGTRTNTPTQIIIGGGVRINVAGTPNEAREALWP